MASYLELKAQAEKLLAQAEELRNAEKAEKVNEIKVLIAQFGISAKDLGFTGGRAKKAGTKASEGTVAFRGPNGEVWSGMGRQPQWIKEQLANGKSKADFAV